MERPSLHVIKIGGKLINDTDELQRFIDAVSQEEGKKIIVHGGGRKATELSALLSIPVKMIDGRRITNHETLEVAIMVYAGLINKQMIARFQSQNVNAIGMCGADGNVIQAHKRPVDEIDYGYVGDVDDVNSDILASLLQADLLPVLCAITHDNNGQLLNTNADTIAAQIAIAMSDTYNVQLKYCFEFAGVLYDVSAPEVTISEIKHAELLELQHTGVINKGMLPKLSNGFDAIEGGVQDVSICGIDNLFSGENATTLK